MDTLYVDHRDLIKKSGFFDAAWYLATYEDVARANVDPLEHYLACGGREDRCPGPSFDAHAYRQRHPDIAAAGLNPLIHYLESRGIKAQSFQSEGQDSSCARVRNLVKESGLFDAAWYLATYEDVARANADPLEHYLACGGREDRCPGPSFDARAYRQRHPDIAATGVNPLVYYLESGDL